MATRSSIRGPIGSGRSSRVTPGAERPASKRGIPCHARTSRRESLGAIDPGSRVAYAARAPAPALRCVGDGAWMAQMRGPGTCAASRNAHRANLVPQFPK